MGEMVYFRSVCCCCCCCCCCCWGCFTAFFFSMAGAESRSTADRCNRNDAMIGWIAAGREVSTNQRSVPPPPPHHLSDSPSTAALSSDVWKRGKKNNEDPHVSFFLSLFLFILSIAISSSRIGGLRHLSVAVDRRSRALFRYSWTGVRSFEMCGPFAASRWVYFFCFLFCFVLF